MADEITLRKYAKGTTIVAMGGQATALYIVVRGEVGISRSEAPDVPAFRVLGAGAMFGEAATLPGMRYRGFARAHTDVLCVVIPQDKLGELGDALM